MREDECILFLTNNKNSLKLYSALKSFGENMVLYSDRLNENVLQRISPKYIVSYNYSHIITKREIEFMKGRIANIHISMLPWNRGSDPNFWSFIDDTPKGVTIHLMDEGIDTGGILCQKELFFDETQETFRTSYDTLIENATKLFAENWGKISKGKLQPLAQTLSGTYHRRDDFNKFIAGRDFDWDMKIAEFKRSL